MKKYKQIEKPVIWTRRSFLSTTGAVVGTVLFPIEAVAYGFNSGAFWKKRVSGATLTPAIGGAPIGCRAIGG